MSDTPIHTQRLHALQLAVQKKQQFNSLYELRNIRMMTILSFLIEFECATASTLLDLVEVQNNSILTRMVKEKFIKIFRWQNSQVYVPTVLGKEWLIDHLDDEEEMARVLESKIRRKIGGYSAEHDLLVQRAAIQYARDNAEHGESWRLFKPRKNDISGPVPDARILYTRDGKQRVVWVEVERTSKPPIEILCKFLSVAALCEQTNATAVFLCRSKAITIDYHAALFALDQLEMQPPQCVRLSSESFRHGLLPGGECFDWSILDVAMIDEQGEVVYDDGGPIEIAFSPVFWMIALKQDEQNWQHWAKKLACAIIDETLDEIERGDGRVTIFGTPARAGVPFSAAEIECAIVEQTDLLLSLLGGHDPVSPDNPYRSAGDLSRARQRYAAMWK